MNIVTKLGAALLLAGCSGSNTQGDFLCAAQIGSPCATIAQADGGGTGARVVPITESVEDSAMATLNQEPLAIGKAGGAYAGMPDGGFAYQSGRYRVPEIVGRLWIAPYLDGNRILHESRYIHFVVSEAHWAVR
jgi:conjugal transfer pilus assembly protein TraV